MSSDEKILTLHPEGKKGVNILRRRYDQMYETLLEIISEQPGITFTDLTREANHRLNGKFDGEISWYVVCVKHDMEAKGIIRRMDRKSPQRLELVREE